jgi:hypothetical protein
MLIEVSDAPYIDLEREATAMLARGQVRSPFPGHRRLDRLLAETRAWPKRCHLRSSPALAGPARSRRTVVGPFG